MKTVFTLFVVALSSGAAFAQSVDPNTLVDDPDGNPPNWCRNGQFPAMAQDYRIARIVRATGRQDGDDGCPSAEAGRCKPDKTLEAGAVVAVSKSYGDFSCAFDARDQSSGWVLTKDLALLPASQVKRRDWLGVWSDGYSGIVIKAVAGGLRVSGSAEWRGATLANGEQVTHVGDIDFVAKPHGARLRLAAKEAYDCAVELVHLGPMLIVRDNGNCGGANVRFNSVYVKK